ncbi:hypothetical protein P20311_0902 [Pseudoalteromonas sp. BSi20311]|nr:hypothetical protein P20311_0902 [Pseudoalteromonas sp. BSi20311]GAA73090.1 hypothetical protein P20439_3206 [Pseudoalteromonas sp. BSi20439]
MYRLKNQLNYYIVATQKITMAYRIFINTNKVTIYWLYRRLIMVII